MKHEQLTQLLYEALETEQGGISIYETALRCAINQDLRSEWTEYLEQTRNHEKVVRRVLGQLKLDPDAETPGRAVVRHIGQSLITAMEMAMETGTPDSAQIVATECVVEAETKDHLNWELLSQFADSTKGPARQIISEAVQEVGEEENEHLYHSTGWARELWTEFLGMPAVLPPPEEEKEVKTAIGAARAKEARARMLNKKAS